MKHQKSKSRIINLVLIWTFLGLTSSQNPSSYQNLINISDLEGFLNKHETLFLFFYHSSLFNHKVIIENLTRIRQMSIIRNSNVNHFPLIDCSRVVLTRQVHFLSVDAQKHASLLKKHVNKTIKSKNPWLVAVGKFQTRVFQNPFTFKNMLDFTKSVLKENPPKLISSVSQFQMIRNELDHFFVRILYQI